MRATNPAVIARNDKVEEALDAVTREGDLRPVQRLLDVLARPFDHDGVDQEFTLPAAAGSPPYRTFCGT
jgi:serine/tyrosine/threonine adenylyltransferase